MLFRSLCGIDIIWRPTGLDRDIKYTGTKPLRRDTEEPHNFEICRGLTIINKYKWSVEYFIQHGYPQTYYTFEEIEAMKDPVILNNWNRKKEEWLKKYGG